MVLLLADFFNKSPFEVQSKVMDVEVGIEQVFHMMSGFPMIPVDNMQQVENDKTGG